MPASLFAAWAGNASAKFEVTAATRVTSGNGVRNSAEFGDIAQVANDTDVQATGATAIPIDVQVVTAVARQQQGRLPPKPHKIKAVAGVTSVTSKYDH